jgi:hypothetical protein
MRERFVYILLILCGLLAQSYGEITPNIVITAREVYVTAPAGVNAGSEIVPGSIVTYVLVVENKTAAPVDNCSLWDKVPRSAHFFGQGDYAPTMNGVGLSNIKYLGPEANLAGAGSAIGYAFDMAAYAKATFTYSVSVD